MELKNIFNIKHLLNKYIILYHFYADYTQLYNMTNLVTLMKTLT